MFMQPQIVKDRWYAIDGTCGTTYVPFDVVGKLDGLERLGDRIDNDPPEHGSSLTNADTYYEGDVESVEFIEGWGARLSAPGYMDCTDWAVCDTEVEAKQHLVDTYDLCSVCLGEVNVDGDWKCANGCETGDNAKVAS